MADEVMLGLITCADAAEAERIAAALLQARLIACAQWSGHQSMYRWQGRVETATEVRLVVKTTAARWQDVVAATRAMHSYELPAIMALAPVAVLAEFAAWVSEEVAGA